MPIIRRNLLRRVAKHVPRRSISRKLMGRSRFVISRRAVKLIPRVLGRIVRGLGTRVRRLSAHGQGLRGLHRLNRPVASMQTINQRNRLAGPEGVRSTGQPIVTGTELPWPTEINKAFAISVRQIRWRGMQARLGPWAKNVQLFSGTNGEAINPRLWMQQGKVARGANLRRGEIGCHDSHVRIWQYIVQAKIPISLIMEDDANLRHTVDHSNRLKRAFDELKRLNIPWDLFYIGRGSEGNFKKYSPSISRPRGCCGLFCYVLTLQGAEKLLANAKPYRIAVDVYVANMSDSGKVDAVALNPKLLYVVPVRSDTALIV